MRFPARRSIARAHSRYDEDDDGGRWEFLPDERLGPPLPRGRSTLPGLIVLLVLLGVGWALIGKQTSWPEWLPPEVAALLSTVTERTEPVPPPRAPVATASARTELPPVAPAPAIERPAPPQAEQDTAMAPQEPAPPQAADDDETAAEPLPPPNVDPADPYQVRAAAVGLHPQLSRVLLAKLSATDYRNAGIAIERALAETPDSGAFVWPLQREPGLAIFRVHFVRGAAADCRRYVVTVAKDGWLTTAPPMERCGLQQPGKPRRE
jgi:hypothetical protein